MDIDKEDLSVDKLLIGEEAVSSIIKKLSRVNLIDTINPEGLILVMALVHGQLSLIVPP